MVPKITQVIKINPKTKHIEHLSIYRLSHAHMHAASGATVALVSLSLLQMVTDGT